MKEGFVKTKKDHAFNYKEVNFAIRKGTKATRENSIEDQ